MLNVAVFATLLWALLGHSLLQKVTSEIVKCDSLQGADAGAKLAACFAALPASGGTADARGLTGEQRITNDVFAGVTKPGKLLLGKTQYELTGPLACIKVPPNWTVEGAADYTSVITGSGYCKAFSNRTVMTTGFNIVFSHFKVEGKNALGESCLAMLNGAHDISVHGLWTDKCGQFGILIGDTAQTGGFRDIQILNNIVTDVGEPTSETNIGIEVFPKGPSGFLAPGLVVRHNRVTGKAGMKVTCGIKMNAADRPIIEDNSVDLREIQVTDASGGGICVVTSDGATIKTNSVLGAKNGIAISGLIDPRNGLRNRNVIIEGNNLAAQTQNGIYSAEGFEGLTIASNTLKKDGGTATRGIFLQRRSESYGELKIIDNEISSYAVALDVDSPGAKPYVARNKTSGKVIVKEQ